MRFQEGAGGNVSGFGIGIGFGSGDDCRNGGDGWDEMMKLMVTITIH